MILLADNLKEAESKWRLINTAMILEKWTILMIPLASWNCYNNELNDLIQPSSMVQKMIEKYMKWLNKVSMKWLKEKVKLKD